MFNSSQILAMTSPEELFSEDLSVMKREYDEMVKRWHPDHNNNSKESNDVMMRINELRDQCIQRIKEGTYHKPGFLRLAGKNGKNHEMRYKVAHSFELGTLYVGNSVSLYLLDAPYREFFINAERVIQDFSYANDAMQQEISKYLPKIVGTFETERNKLGLVIAKTPDLFLLRDLLLYHNGKVPARHVAWIMSSLYNLACYLHYANLSHNGITIDTYFVSPHYHSGALLGGWWYTVPQGQKMMGISSDIFSILPPSIKDQKQGSIKTDLESIRLIGRELLGDRNGTHLTETDIPQPLIDWLRGTSSANAFDEYTMWMKVLQDSFGERRFIPMEIDPSDFYKTINK